MLDLNKYSGKDKSEIFHTSGHARLGQGDRIGSAGNQSFQQRLELAQRSRMVADYGRSAIGDRRNHLVKAKKATPTTSRLKRATGEGTGSPRQAFNAGEQQKPASGFKEPPSRGYNPYA